MSDLGTLPADEAAERAVLGALLVNPKPDDLIPRVISILGTSPDAFFTVAHQLIYSAVVHLYDQRRHCGHPYGCQTPERTLNQLSRLTATGVPGNIYLNDLQAAVSSRRRTPNFTLPQSATGGSAANSSPPVDKSKNSPINTIKTSASSRHRHLIRSLTSRFRRPPNDNPSPISRQHQRLCLKQIKERSKEPAIDRRHTHRLHQLRYSHQRLATRQLHRLGWTTGTRKNLARSQYRSKHLLRSAPPHRHLQP